jgi:GNAT superfamily N-acetyltransferase
MIESASYEFRIYLHTDTRDAVFEKIMQIYRDSFPENERQPGSILEERIRTGLETLSVAFLKDEPVGFCLVWTLKDTAFDLLDYLAVRETSRGSGYGTLILHETAKRVLQGGRSLVIEVEDPDYGYESDWKRRRIEFYTRNGAAILEGFSYILPPLDGTRPTRMRLLFFNGDKRRCMERWELGNLIRRIYKDVYGRDGDDPYLQEMFLNLPVKPKLSYRYGESRIG